MLSPAPPPLLHLVGRKRSGKTELMIQLIRSLSARGYRIAGVRHSPHSHCIDTEGSDTAAYKKAGYDALFSAPVIGIRHLFLAHIVWINGA